MFWNKRKKFTVEVVKSFDEKTWKDILEVRKQSFSEGFLYEDEEEYFKRMLDDKSAINLLLKKKGKSVGYLLAKKHNEAWQEIGKDDPKMTPDSKRYYIDTLAIVPSERGNFAFLELILALIKESQKRGISKFSMHIRKANNLSQKVQLLFRNSITKIRHIDSWRYGGGEPYDYLEGDFKKSVLNLRLKLLLYKKLKKIKRYAFGNYRTENMYMPLKQARKEILKRWENDKLKNKVRKILGGVPDIFNDGPKAVLFRYIATPDFEYVRARKLADELGLKLVYLEFLKDKFCTINCDKLSLGKMNFFHCKRNKDNNVILKRKIFDVHKYDGKKFSEIPTFSGEKLVDFHHRLFKPYLKEAEILDISDWIKKRGKNARETYPKFLLLFTCFGILLEAYNEKSAEEKKFVNQVVKPAFEEVKRITGFAPIIVRLYDRNEENSVYWYCYPEYLLNKIKL